MAVKSTGKAPASTEEAYLVTVDTSGAGRPGGKGRPAAPNPLLDAVRKADKGVIYHLPNAKGELSDRARKHLKRAQDTMQREGHDITVLVWDNQNDGIRFEIVDKRTRTSPKAKAQEAAATA